MTNKPTYYHILQVEPDADAPSIRAAYRRLMRRYHPDVVTPEQRADPATQELARLINEAYAILSDPIARAVYDGMQRAGQDGALRLAHIRCSHTHSTFHAVLLFDAANGDLFHVMEFGGMQPLAERSRRERLRLTSRRLLRWVLPRAFNVPTRFADAGRPLAVEQDLIDFGQINWHGLTCPDCGQIRENPNGTRGAWTVCRLCGQLACLGGVFETTTGPARICPWCAAFRPMTFSVAVGTLADRAVRGTRPHGDPQRRLEDAPIQPDARRDQS